MFGVHAPNLNLGVQIDSVKQQIKSNSVGSWYVSHCGTSVFYHHLYHGSLSSKCRASHQIKKTSRSTRHNQHYSIQDCCAWVELWFGFGCACLMWCHATSFLGLDLCFSLIELEKSERLQQPNPCARLLLSCVRPRSISCTSNLLVQLFDFKKYTRVDLILILSLQGLMQNQNLETIQVCIVVLCYPHNNIACIHLCDECTRSNASIVCLKLWSTLWPHEQVCSQTTKYLVYQYVPKIQTFQNILWANFETILLLTHFLLL